MNEILFIRHAETDMAGTFCGHSDPELNSRGTIQVAELIAKIRMEHIGAVYTSDLCRCRVTARAVAETFGVACYERRELREINFGQWEGLTWEQVERKNRAYAQRWMAEYPYLHAPGGENFRDFERRVLSEMKFMLREAENWSRRIAVVTHAGVLRIILCKLLDSSAEDAWNQTKTYCSIIRYPVTQSFLEAKMNE